MSNLNKIHNNFKLNGLHYDLSNLKELALGFINSEMRFQKHVGQFFIDWLDSNDTISVMTSGSTGVPKNIQLKKEAMVNSALATGVYFNLKPTQKALHCLPSNFIAGKMMLVRAIVLGLEIDIVEPSSKPLNNNIKQYDFCAMIPLQLQNSLLNVEIIKTLIVGGAATSKTLINKLQDISTKIYATYGMTETITHIAVKQLNHYPENNFYQVLPNISITTDKRDCLVINAPKLHLESIITNDIVSLKSGSSFELLGRYDTVINSGGIKLIPEQIESKLYNVIHSRFFITSEKDEQLGQRLILIIEGETTINTSIFSELAKYERPKKIYYLKQFIETATAKVNRVETLKLIK